VRVCVCARVCACSVVCVCVCTRARAPDLLHLIIVPKDDASESDDMLIGPPISLAQPVTTTAAHVSQ